MAREPLTLWGSTAVMSSFVMGVEMLLLLLYVRLEINTAAKRAIRRQVAARLGEGAGDPVETDEAGMDGLAERVFKTVGSKDGVAEKAYLDAGGAGLTWLAMVSYVLLAALGSGASYYALKGRAVRTPMEDGPWTHALITLGCLGVITAGQYAFLKLAVLPFYADTYNKIADEAKRIPRLEKDDWKLTLRFAAPSAIAFATAAAIAYLGRGSFSWKLVAMATLLTGVTGVTELLAWGLMKGIAVPMDHILASANNAALVMASKDDKETKMAMLNEVFFDGKHAGLNVHSFADHLENMYWNRRDVRLDDEGKIKVVPAANASKKETVFMVLCAVVLMLVPAGAVAFRANFKDSLSLGAQCAALFASYGLFIGLVGETATMRKIATGMRSPPDLPTGGGAGASAGGKDAS